MWLAGRPLNKIKVLKNVLPNFVGTAWSDKIFITTWVPPKNPHHYLQKTYIKSIVASGSCLNKKQSIKFVLPVFIGTAWSEKNVFSYF